MFTVVATSGTALSYQWYYDGWLFFDKKLTGQTSSTLILTNVSSGDEGQYFVEVINAGGTVFSRKAALTIYTAPVANHDTYTTLEDAALIVPAAGILGNDTDADGDALTAVLVNNVTQGSLSLGTNGGFTYTPNTNYSGSDSFTYRASDSLIPVVAILQQNNAGGGNTLIRNKDKGTQSFRHGTAGDPDYMLDRIVLYLSRRSGGSGNLNFSIGTARNGGRLAGSARAIPASSITNTSAGTSFQTYAIVYGAPLGPFTAGTTYYLNLDNQTGDRVYLEYPNANTYAGGTYYDDGINQNKDMRFQVFGSALSALATVTINVTPVNDPPLAIDDTVSMLENESMNIKVLDNDSDPDGTPLTVTGTSTTNGTAVITANGTKVLFTPSANFNGTMFLTYTVSDGTNSATTSVTVTVTPVNYAPVANNDTYTTLEDVPLIVPPSAGILTNDVDADGDALIALLLTNVSNGSLSLNTNGSFTYIPNTNYHGSDNFTYRVSDGLNPVAAILQQNVSGGDKTEIKDNKPGAQSFRHGSAGGPAYSVSKVSLRLSRTPVAPNVNLNFSIGTGINSGPIAGSTFAITMASISNTSGGSSFQDYEIAYAAPVGRFTAGTTYYLNLDFAPTGKEVWIELAGNAYANGTYYEDGSDLGKDMRFQIHGITHSDIATVTLTVTPVNDAPVANDDTYTTPEDVPLTIPATGILANDLDVDGDALTALLVSDVSHGTLALNADGSFTYTPVADYNGPDSFSYRAADASTTGNVAIVAINVTPVSDPLKFTSLQMTESGFDVGVAGDVAAYVISASSNLRDWTPIFTNAAPMGPIVYTDTAAQNHLSRFYRIDTRY